MLCNSVQVKLHKRVMCLLSISLFFMFGKVHLLYSTIVLQWNYCCTQNIASIAAPEPICHEPMVTSRHQQYLLSSYNTIHDAAHPSTTGNLACNSDAKLNTTANSTTLQLANGNATMMQRYMVSHFFLTVAQTIFSHESTYYSTETWVWILLRNEKHCSL